jgi:hypothetical protein
MTNTDFEVKDPKPPMEQKTEWPTGEANAPDNTAAAKEAQNARNGNILPDQAAQGDANTIASPDVFLTERHRHLGGQSLAIRQVWSDGAERGYVIVSGSKIGYFELSEGMDRAEAEDMLNKAYDGTAVVL